MILELNQNVLTDSPDANGFRLHFELGVSEHQGASVRLEVERSTGKNRSAIDIHRHH